MLQGALWICLVAAVACRFVALDHLPGLNGDEAYLGTKVLLWAAGDAISLKTGSGLYADPISLWLSRLLHWVLGASFFTLRLSSACSGMATILVMYLLARRWGRTAALTSAVLAAALPTHIVYSRFFWEPSQSPLIAAAWLLAAVALRPVWTCLLGALAVVVHPTNAFLAPVVAWPYLVQLLQWFAQRRERSRRVGSGAGLSTLLFVVFAGASALVVLGVLYRDHALVSGAVTGTLARLTNQAPFLDFLANYPGLLTGTTVYTYILGKPDPTVITLHSIAFAALFILPVMLSLLVQWRRLAGLALSLAVALLTFYLVAGPDALHPNSERYALWMTVPHCLLVALAWDHLAAWVRSPNLGKVAVLVVSAMMLVTFWRQYFWRLRTENSVSEASFATAPVEPKLAAFERIVQLHDPTRRARIFAEDWWTYWAMKYLSVGRAPGFEVTILGSAWDRRFPTDFILTDPADPAVELFYVGYPQGSFAQRVTEIRPSATRVDFRGYGDRVVLQLFIGQQAK